MTDIEPIVTAWLLSPVGLIIMAVIAIVAIVMRLAKMMTTFPSKEF